MFAYQIKIPKERIAVLIGKGGDIKKRIEEETHIMLEIDSKEGDVSIKGEDALLLYTAREIVKAIARGFNPDIALLLLKQDYSFEMINLPEFDKPTQFRRIKGRVIGKDGKSRELIEEYTDCYISVYGKTVSLIGRNDSLHISRRAVEMLIQGSPHSNVYRWLEKMRREIKRREYEEKVEDFLVDPKKKEE